MATIPLFRPSVSDLERQAILEVLDSRWWTMGPKCEEFERALAERYRKRFCLTVNSATAALHLAMKALEVSSCDEVIVPALTFVSTALAATYCRADVVFADVREDTLTIDWRDVERKVTKFTAAVVPVDYAGYPADDFSGLSVQDVLGFTAKIPRGAIVQDAAHSAGGRAYGDLVCFSFHPVKNIGTGDGGAILTDDEEIYYRLKALRWCGIDRSTYEREGKAGYNWDYDIREVGFKYHWNDLQASLGLAQLQRLGELNSARRLFASRYHDALYSLQKEGLVTLPAWHDQHTWHIYALRVDARIRDKLIDFAGERGVSLGVHYKPLTHYPMYQGETPPVTEREWKRLVSLPMYPDMQVAEQQRVCEVLDEGIQTLSAKLKGSAWERIKQQVVEGALGDWA